MNNRQKIQVNHAIHFTIIFRNVCMWHVHLHLNKMTKKGKEKEAKLQIQVIK